MYTPQLVYEICKIKYLQYMYCTPHVYVTRPEERVAIENVATSARYVQALQERYASTTLHCSANIRSERVSTALATHGESDVAAGATEMLESVEQTETHTMCIMQALWRMIIGTMRSMGIFVGVPMKMEALLENTKDSTHIRKRMRMQKRKRTVSVK